MTTYKQIFDLALKLYDDPSLLQWPEEDLINELYGHLEMAIASIPQVRNEVAERDEFEPGCINSAGFHNDLSDVTKMVLALGCRKAWLAPQIASSTLTNMVYSKKESYSQREHLRGLMELDANIDLKIKQLLRDNSYVDSEYYN